MTFFLIISFDCGIHHIGENDEEYEIHPALVTCYMYIFFEVDVLSDLSVASNPLGNVEIIGDVCGQA